MEREPAEPAGPVAQNGPAGPAAPNGSATLAESVAPAGSVAPGGPAAPAGSAVPTGPARTTAPPAAGGGPRPAAMYRPLVRRRTARAVAGVAGGVADHLGVPVFWVRAVFTALAALGGVGLLAYGLLWVFVPQAPPDAEPVAESPRERQQALGLAAVGVGLAIASGTLGDTAGGWVTGPLGIALVGAAVVWREADEAQRQRIRTGASTIFGAASRPTLFRLVAGVVLVAGGILVFLLGRVNLDQLQFALLAVVATLVGVAVLTVPWWLRLMSELGEERRARIRNQERAEIAAHLHDSVLQTLALIQKKADTAREVRRLARGQERELRNYLYPTKSASAAESLADALSVASAEVEDTYAVEVQQVVVGDCELDEQQRALAQATREAMINAAKHAGVGEISLYVEVEPDVVHVFVRDRGAGFDADAVPADRHGLTDSIRGRMNRNGGSVRLRTAPGEGTEVQLVMPRSLVKETVREGRA